MRRSSTKADAATLARSAARGAKQVMALTPIPCALLALGLVATGRLSTLHAGWTEIAAVAALSASVVFTLFRRMRRASIGGAVSLRDDVELGSLLLGAAFLIIEIFGTSLFPLVFLVMAFLVAFLSRRAGVALVGIALLFDAAKTLLPEHREPLLFATHAAFLILFAGLYHLVLAVQVAKNRATEKSAVDRRIKEMEERARAYRLVSAGSGGDAEEDRERWVQASVKEIEGAVGAAMEVAEISLKTHTCAAFVLTSDEKCLKLHDCRSGSDFVQREAFPAGEGVLGCVLKRRAPVRIQGNVKGVSYYERNPGVGSVLAVPIIEGQGAGAVRGVLVADRLQPVPFNEDDERLLATVAGEVLRAMEVERVLGYIKRARDEKDRLYRAIEELNRASKTSQAVAAALDMARTLARLDFAALTLVEEDNGRRRHRVAGVTGVSSGRAVEGLEFADNTGLCANVVRYGAPLPGRDVRQMDRPVVFDEDTQLKGLNSLKILPLRAGERILGTLVAGTRRKAAFDDDLVRTLEVLAMQAAQSILRSSLFEQMERMATTDGLTGLLNHRTFQARFDEALQLANRYKKKISFILTDIDHFKSVNDTYGHPIGDLVLKGVAKILRKGARDTDIVARYGGEEFCIIMPETDGAGAKVIAERIRKEIEKTVFDTEMGPLKITLSLGIATFPEVGKEKQVLIDKADQCLYFAKHHGRNKSVTVQEMELGGRVAAQA